MKKYLFMAVAGILALSSCSKDNDELVNGNTPRQMTFTAGYGGVADTRATMTYSGADKGKVSFDANDRISILSAKNENKEFTTTAGGASATFTGTAADDSRFYAVYPYTSGLTLDGTVVHGVVIPTTQVNLSWAYFEDEPQEGWDPKAPVALAVADPGAALQFQNLCAILKIDLPDDGNNYSVTVSANESIAGTFDLNTADGTLTATSGSKQVTTGDENNIFADGNRYIYLAIAPGTYTNFKVMVTDGKDGTTTRNKESVLFEKGKVYSLGQFKL